jgi:uncharacterized protein (TIGR02231 family)
MLVSLLTASALCAFVPQAAQGTHVPSALRAVTVYPGTALVTRAATLAQGDGRYLLGGLPLSADPASVRVRISGGELVALDTRERDVPKAESGRIAELTKRLQELEAQKVDLEDRLLVQKGLDVYLHNLITGAAGTHDGASQQPGALNGWTWDSQYGQLEAKLAANAQSRRALTREIEQLDKELQRVRTELGHLDAHSTEKRRELVLDVVGGGGEPIAIEVDYLVGNAGWVPQYDLRADAQLHAVELSYRAKIWQQSGEDWRDCEIDLSTAQPQRGAQGPEPRPTWLRVYDPTPASEVAFTYSLGESAAREAPAQDQAQAVRKDKDAKTAAFASVSSQGLSLRYKLARKETIESRSEPTQVLVGRASLGISAEHVCVPALDTSVWLRALTKNSSEWVLLPGTAAVYFGSDYVGPAEIGTVQRGEEFTLHLGVDPNWKIERTQTLAKRAEGGVFSSRQSDRERWKLTVENLGSPGAAADGSVTLLVRETLPRSADERITIKLEDPKPKPSEAERWKKDREDNGILTFELRVPRGAATVLEWGTEVTWPEGLQLSR